MHEAPCAIPALWPQSFMLNTYRVFMFSVLNISSCKHSSGCLLLCIPSVFAIAVSTWGSPRNVDFSRPPSSTVETSASQVFDLNWKQTKTWIWGLDECSVFANLFPRVNFPAGQRVTGRPELRSHTSCPGSTYGLDAVAFPYGIEQFPSLM